MLGNPLLLSDDGYQISRSVRLRSSASAYFNRTPASAGNRRTFTLSVWVKRGRLGATQWLFDADNGSTDSTEFNFAFTSSDTLFVSGSSTTWRITTQVFRDPSAWYHIILSVDTTQATANNRIRLYVNGSEITAFGTLNNPTQNLDLGVNQAIAHYLGIRTGLTSPLDGYLTEVNFIDGQALTQSSFGETDAITGVWKPKKFAGTYGTNGFYLNFSDNSAATAAAIGKDYSGNGNNWTPNNISVTSGTTYDSMLDVPTMWADGGNGRGNYCAGNPLDQTGCTFSNGNLQIVPNAGGSNVGCGTFGMTSGKWYWEVTMTQLNTTNGGIVGVADQSVSLANRISYNTAGGWYYEASGLKWNSSTTGASYGNTYATGDIVGIALDMDNGKVWFSKNGTWQASGDPSAGTNAAFTNLSGKIIVAAFNNNSGSATQTYNANFGQRPFSYTPPSGFKALNTQNLPDSTIKKGNQYFDVSTWTGDQTSRTITNSGAFQPDFVWTKSRSDAESHRLHDAVRGGNGSVLYELNSNETSAEGTDTLVSGFASNGFTIASGANSPNVTGRTYVGWQWKESATAGFDIVTWSGNSTSGRTISHSLGVAPQMIITKSRSNASSWVVGIGGISGFGVNDYLVLQTTGAKGSSSTFYQAYGSSTFTVGVSAADEMNKTGNNYVSYLFAEVAGFSKFGSYTGNGSTDGPFVFCGFRPRYIMIKESSSTGSWVLLDTSRSPYNVSNNASLWANLSDAEGGAAAYLDILSNGFKIRDTDSDKNTSSQTYIFAAFAEFPFRNSLAR